MSDAQRQFLATLGQPGPAKPQRIVLSMTFEVDRLTYDALGTQAEPAIEFFVDVFSGAAAEFADTLPPEVTYVGVSVHEVAS